MWHQIPIIKQTLKVIKKLKSHIIIYNQTELKHTVLESNKNIKEKKNLHNDVNISILKTNNWYGANS